MPLGLPCDLTIYKLLTDWGSFIAGLLALVAGGIAYAAGLQQASATKRAMDRQLAAQTAAQAAEVANVRTALRAEVVAFVKFVIGTLDICEGIAKKTTTMPRSQANAIVRGLQEPSVFPAVADRIAALANPHLPVQFYARIEEAKSIANTLSLATDAYGVAGIAGAVIPVPMVTPANALPIADCLITALQLGRAIVADQPADASPAEQFVTAETVQQIDAAIASAKQTFPDAESFKVPDDQAGAN
jgi:hypothetical protein